MLPCTSAACFGPSEASTLYPHHFEERTSRPWRVRYVKIIKRLSRSSTDFFEDTMTIIGWPKPDPDIGNYWGWSYFDRTVDQSSTAQVFSWTPTAVEAQDYVIDLGWTETLAYVGAASPPSQPGISPTMSSVSAHNLRVRVKERRGWAASAYSTSTAGEFSHGISLGMRRADLLRGVSFGGDNNEWWRCTSERLPVVTADVETGFDWGVG